MVPSCWTTRLRAAISSNSKDAHSRYVSLATVDKRGAPRCRTVVFRGFLNQYLDREGLDGSFEEGERSLTFVTDMRSAKVNQSSGSCLAEVSWYFSRTRVQFRLRGTLRIVGNEDVGHWSRARTRAWKSLSENARSQFAWNNPGRPLPETSMEMERKEHPLDPLVPLPTFGLVALLVERVDELSLKENRRWIYRHSSSEVSEDDLEVQEDAPGTRTEAPDWLVWEVNP